MIRISQAILVEGRYDKIKLSSIFDALIIELNGFGIFKDKEKARLICSLAETRGIIIFTDSDKAGMLIRNHIRSIVKNGKVYNAYIPPIAGKEKRKQHVSAEGLLGVEGIKPEIIINAVKNSGIKEFKSEISPEQRITNTDLFKLGFTGGADSSKKRGRLLSFLNLPQNLSKNSLLKVLEYSYTIDELKEFTAQLERG